MPMSAAEKSARYRAKDIDEYRRKKREYAKTPAQRAKRNEYMAKYREKNREKFNEQCRLSHEKKRRERSPESRHDQHLWHTYGIRRDDYLAMLASQHEQCAICASPTPRWKHRFHVDHCHESGRIRGLLCNRCNPMLGWFERYAEKINEYLKEN